MRLDARAPDHEIKAAALWQAGRARNLLRTYGYSMAGAVRSAIDSEGQLAGVLNGLAVAAGACPLDGNMALPGRVARMVDAGWWTRNLRRATLRENENTEHAAGLVRKNLQCYVSDHAGKIRAERDKANRETLEGLEVMNEDGEAFNLQEVADASVSNPKLRRAELMTRCRGFEEAAQFMGHTGYFLTLTCPSRFHRVNYAGIENKKWQGATVKDGQAYLCNVFAKIRAAWKKKGLTPYGFRVAEPHHDGCPHWHILLFFNATDARVLLSIASRYALEDNPNESGAQKRRFTVKRIDPSKGSATGYIAKYICKNIDGAKENGEAMGLDFASGTPAEQAARRVRDWAGVHRIRQFQQIGGPSVTVWRELRRLGKDADTLQLELFEKPRAAASRGDWFSFWMVQGGPDVARKDLTVKPFYVEDDLGKYGDVTAKIKGVTGIDEQGFERLEITRLKEWTVQRAGQAVNELHQFAANEAREFKRSNAAFMQAYEDLEFKRISEANQARTGINNCSKPVFDFSSFEADPGPGIYATTEPRMGSPQEQAEIIAESERQQARYPNCVIEKYRINVIQ